MSDKTPLSFETIAERFEQTKLPQVDAVVGIQSGGRVIASLCAYRLKCPLFMLPIHFRDLNNDPEHDSPQIFNKNYKLPAQGKSILLVDDVSVSGKTMDVARSILGQNYKSITTLVLKGKGDIVLFPEVEGCVSWPWFQGMN